MTLQEAKDQIAKKHGFKDWQSINMYELGERLSWTAETFDEHMLDNEAAELYARSKWDEACEAQLLNLYTHINKNGLILAGERVYVRKPEFKP